MHPAFQSRYNDAGIAAVVAAIADKEVPDET